jgi:pyroglutamyl-peptidase
MLLTGFEPFGGDTSNPSWTVAQALNDVELNGVRVVSKRLPVDGRKAPRALKNAIVHAQPAAIIMLGLARGRVQVALERVAVNVMDYRIPDNAGRVQTGQSIHPDGPDAYLSSLPVDDILKVWRTHKLPGYVSNSAGLYLCNQVFYVARHAASVPAGFIHLPSDETLVLDRQEAFVPLEFQLQMVRLALEVTAASLEPIRSKKRRSRR